MKTLLVWCCALSLGARVFGAPIELTDKAVKGAFPLVTAHAVADFVVDAADAPVVTTAAEAVAADLQLITGQLPEVVTELRSGRMAVIAGTLGRSELIDRLAKQGRIEAKRIRGQWETFLLQVVVRPFPGVARALVVAGSDPRGTAFGLFELSRRAGVSPYVWWADVLPEPRSELYATGQTSISNPPSVQFRGMFINDEDFGLMPWAAAKMDPDRKNIGPNTYAKVAELLLRLRANTLWPAMHACSEAFWANPANVEVARRYGIVLGSSHCEQMLRDNEWEWRRQGLGEKEWNWKTNRAAVQTYWAERVGQSRGIDAMYTLGMRGVHDTGMNGYTREDRVEGLTDVIGWQRRLLADSIGDPTAVPQIFIPYKEVLEAYNDGLQLPDDVTLCWVDDNHGYIRQLPTPAEQARSGGNGIYYHLSYLGTPVPWTWLSSVSPSLISFELTKAYQNKVRKLWIINVGDIKPQEAEFEFCMDLAYDIDSYAPEQAFRYIRDWAARTFGEAYADAVARIRRTNYRLSAGGKPEHIYANPYSIREQEERIAAYEAAMAEIDSLRPHIPARLQDAYFQLVVYPVKAAGLMNKKVFRQQQSERYAKAGMREEAVAAYESAAVAYASIQTLTERYNKTVAGGKWDGMMTFLSWGHRPAQRIPEDIADAIAAERTEIDPGRETVVRGDRFVSAAPTVRVIEGLGTSDFAATVWPMDGRAYGPEEIAAAPSVVYAVPVKAGENRIEVRCLCSFPLNPGYDLRIAVSIAGAAPEIHSVRTFATVGKWHQTSIAGYSSAAESYTAESDGTVEVRVSLLDPGVVVNELRSTPMINRGLLRHNFFYAGESKRHRMYKVQDGQIVWEYLDPTGRGEISDAMLMSDGHILMAHQYGIKEIDAEKRVVWSMDTPKGYEIHSIRPIGSDHVLYVQCGNPMTAVVMEIPSLRIVRRFEIPHCGKTHGQNRSIELTRSGTLLVASLDMKAVYEFDADGNQLNRWEFPHAWGVRELENGNLLIASNEGKIREMTRGGEVVWAFDWETDERYPHISTQKAYRLKNGNTLISNWFNEWSRNEVLDRSNPPVQYIEVTPDNRIVWELSSWNDPADLGPSTTLQLLDEPIDRSRCFFGPFNR